MRKVVNGVRVEMTQDEISAFEASRAPKPPKAAEVAREAARAEISKPMPNTLIGLAARLSAIEVLLGLKGN